MVNLGMVYHCFTNITLNYCSIGLTHFHIIVLLPVTKSEHAQVNKNDQTFLNHTDVEIESPCHKR